MVAVVASIQGWNVIYLGPNMPATEIAQAVKQSAADALGLSIVFPLADPEVSDELRILRQALGQSVPILVGGRAVGSYSAALTEIGAHEIPSLARLRHILDDLR